MYNTHLSPQPISILDAKLSNNSPCPSETLFVDQRGLTYNKDVVGFIGHFPRYLPQRVPLGRRNRYMSCSVS